jgi:hypothetical protein
MVVTVGAALLDVKSVAWYSISFCVAVDCDGQPCRDKERV